MSYISVDTEGDTINFNLDGETPGRAVLQLKNTHNGNIAYKIKTTAPKEFVVKPI